MKSLTKLCIVVLMLGMVVVFTSRSQAQTLQPRSEEMVLPDGTSTEAELPASLIGLDLTSTLALEESEVDAIKGKGILPRISYARVSRDLGKIVKETKAGGLKTLGLYYTGVDLAMRFTTGLMTGGREWSWAIPAR